MPSLPGISVCIPGMEQFAPRQKKRTQNSCGHLSEELCFPGIPPSLPSRRTHGQPGRPAWYLLLGAGIYKSVCFLLLTALTQILLLINIIAGSRIDVLFIPYLPPLLPVQNLHTTREYLWQHNPTCVSVEISTRLYILKHHYLPRRQQRKQEWKNRIQNLDTAAVSEALPTNSSSHRQQAATAPPTRRGSASGRQQNGGLLLANLSLLSTISWLAPAEHTKSLAVLSSSWRMCILFCMIYLKHILYYWWNKSEGLQQHLDIPVLLKKWPSHYYSHWLLVTSKINVIEYEIFAEADKCVIAEQDLIFAVVRG